MDGGGNRSAHDFTNVNISGDARAHLGNSYTFSKDETQLHFFKTSNYEGHKNFNPKRVRDTCKWFLDHPTYIRWRDSDRNDLLWLSADPGCGKSVLSRALIDERLVCGESASIYYFFFKDNEEQNSVLTAICALLHQLFCSKGTLFKKHASPAIKENGERLKVEVENLWRLLVAAATDSKAGNVICVLDALDECKQDERNTLIRMLEDFYTRSYAYSRTRSSLKFLVTSRPYQHIELSFSSLTKDVPTIRLAGEDESEDISLEINIVITAKIKEIGEELGLSEAVRSSLDKRLQEITNRTYLWLTLIWEEIRNALGKTEKKLLKVIEELPHTVDEAYEKLLARCSEEDNARKILQIIVAAERPLTLVEMDVALEIQAALEKQADPKSYADLDREGEENRKTQIRNLCGLFVSIADSKIYLIHQTAKEFLIKRTDEEPGLGGWKHSLDLQESHRLLAQICLTHLLFGEFRKSPLSWQRIAMGRKWQDFIVVRAYSAKHAFLDYSANQWPSHIRKARESEIDKLISLASELFEEDGPDLPTWLNIFCSNSDVYEDSYADWTHIMVCSRSGWALYFAAIEGLTGLIRRLLRSGVDVNAHGGVYGNALQAAAARGYTEVAQLLIQANADVDAQGGFYGNALQAAVAHKSKDVVQLLIQANVDVDAQGGYCNNVLQAAVAGGDKDIIKLLIQANADITAQGGVYGNALQAAADSEHNEVVRPLLQANPYAQRRLYGNALRAAAADGNKELVQLWIQAGADVNAKGGNWGNEHSLHAAVANGDEEVVQMLLQAGADINARSELSAKNLGGTRCRSALYIAVEYQHENIVEALLKAGADVNAQHGAHGPALKVAVRGGNQRLVHLLLQAGADVNARSGFWNKTLGLTMAGEALYLAVAYQYEKVVEVLLQGGADVNSQNDSSFTALHVAVVGGSESIVQLLLQAKVDVHTRCEFHSEKLGRRRWGDALLLAVEFNHVATVETLLQRGAAANPDSYCEALQAAEAYGYKNIVGRMEKWVNEEARCAVAATVPWQKFISNERNERARRRALQMEASVKMTVQGQMTPPTVGAPNQKNLKRKRADDKARPNPGPSASQANDSRPSEDVKKPNRKDLKDDRPTKQAPLSECTKQTDSKLCPTSKKETIKQTSNLDTKSADTTRQTAQPEEERLGVKRAAPPSCELRMAKRSTQQWLEAMRQPSRTIDQRPGRITPTLTQASLSEQSP